MSIVERQIFERQRTSGTEQHTSTNTGKPDTGLRTLAVFKDGQTWVPHESKPNILRRVIPQGLAISTSG